MKEHHKAFIPVLNDIRNGIIHVRCIQQEETYIIEAFHMLLETDSNNTRLLEFETGGVEILEKFETIYKQIKDMRPEEIENAFGISILWKP